VYVRDTACVSVSVCQLSSGNRKLLRLVSIHGHVCSDMLLQWLHISHSGLPHNVVHSTTSYHPVFVSMHYSSSCLHDYIEIGYAWTFTPQKLATTCLSAAGWKFLHIEAMQQPRNHIKCRKLVLTSISIISKSSQPLHALHGTAIAFCSQERCMVFRSIDTCHDLQLHALQV